MKPTYYISLLLSGIALSVFSQNRVNYTYDAAGNRLSGLSSQLRMAVVSGQEAKEEFDSQEIIYSDQIEQPDIRIYPNPTRGILKIEITRTAKETPVDIQLYDMSGRMIISKPNAAPFTDLNISDQPMGTYILKIFLDNKAAHWKIIKE